MAERRPHVIFAPISERDLVALRDFCRQKQRTTEFIAGEVLHAWIEEQRHAKAQDSTAEQHSYALSAAGQTTDTVILAGTGHE